MRIQSIKLKNFRGFKELEVELDGKSAIFYGINGAGKTSILRAVDLAYANIIGMLLQTKKRLAELNNWDIYDHAPSAKIEICLKMENGQEFAYNRAIDAAGKKTHDKDALDEIVSCFNKEYTRGDIYGDDESFSSLLNVAMPIFVNYGVNRTVIGNVMTSSIKVYSSLDAFENAIESYIDFKGFFNWFKQSEDLENEMIANGKKFEGKDKLPVLEAVRNAMLSMFSDFTNVRFDRLINTLVFEKNGEQLSLNQLSDGEKCTIALFGDVARRMAIANNGREINPLQGTGVVLIDEIDLHLHPAWQRQILDKLSETFPNVQFLVTTHSPQVLGGAGDDYKTFSLKTKNNEIVVDLRESMYGWDTNIILEEAMGTDSVNAEVKKHIENMYQAYDEGHLDIAATEADWVDQVTNGHNNCVSGIRVMIARKNRRTMNEKN